MKIKKSIVVKNYYGKATAKHGLFVPFYFVINAYQIEYGQAQEYSRDLAAASPYGPRDEHAYRGSKGGQEEVSRRSEWGREGVRRRSEEGGVSGSRGEYG